MPLASSELILNADQSVYHLNLRKEDLADTVILVGDPDRVSKISQHFDTIEIKKSKREFITHTGISSGRRISVVSTGIGTDNIDIVLNELDALVNIDFESREPKQDLKQLQLIRLGTSGAIQPDIPVDAFLLSDYAIGFDGLLHYYQSEKVQLPDIQYSFLEHSGWPVMRSVPYVVAADQSLNNKLFSENLLWGFTATNAGFYGPQGRVLRLQEDDPEMQEKITAFRYKDLRITNMEMETAGIFGLAALMGHKAASLNCILANRCNGTFSKNPGKTVDSLILYTLEKLANLPE
ncbi:nucleoside phosphorylase [Robiginitalea sp. IMCC43444]|uniref:nucleoside phosphorylase n=1 Tax=Robiginitalea sp. IMCC43444 TaxID=3459121 RepID=UPI004042B53C